MSINAQNRHRVLILAPTGMDASVLENMLRTDGLNACSCSSMEDMCRCIDEISGVAVIAEEALTSASIDLLAQTVQREPEWSDFPFIIMASAGTDPDRIWAALAKVKQALNVNVLVRPVLARTFLTAVHSSLRSRDAQYRVALELKRRRKAEDTLKAANEELQAFSYSVSHDLRAPLRTMRGFSQFLLEDYSDRLDDTGRDYLNRIIRGADQMGTLINDLLTFSRTSRQEMSVGEVDLSALAAEVVAGLRDEQPDRDIDITIHEGIKTRGDRNLLKIALTNLLGNAWKYTLKTSGSRIEMGCMHQDNETVFFVKDNGVGFNMDKADRLFAPFQRLHSEKEFSGTGIGLPIAARVVGRHGGRIWAQSEPGRGATFFFTLG
ncbi:MAG: sensor histidine kinase [Fibrobacterota bacterium]